MSVTFRLRRDTAGNWATVNPVLGLGEPGYETDSHQIKIGDGATRWNALGYVEADGPDALGTMAEQDADNVEITGGTATFDDLGNRGTLSANIKPARLFKWKFRRAGTQYPIFCLNRGGFSPPATNNFGGMFGLAFAEASLGLAAGSWPGGVSGWGLAG